MLLFTSKFSDILSSALKANPQFGMPNDKVGNPK
ncbi:MAG: hypothetical protein RIQ62_1688 [Bacteroidota bacterium]